jgi:flagellar basal-body rod protein FlgB
LLLALVFAWAETAGFHMYDFLSKSGLVNLADQAMGLAVRRQTLIASNLANIDTPGYRTQDLDFEQALKAALGQNEGQSLPMARTNAMHFGGAGGSSPAISHPGKPSSERNDGNDVSLDRESMLLARTQSTYQMAALLAQGEIRKLRGAISESLAH